MVNIQGIAQQRVGDRNLNLAQERILRAINDVTRNPVINGVIATQTVSGAQTTEFDLESGDNTINHGLNRELIGYLIIGKSAAVDIYDKQATNTQKNRTLILNSSGAVTVKLYVF